MWGLFSKQKRTKTLLGLAITVAVVWLVYSMFLSGTTVGEAVQRVASGDMFRPKAPHYEVGVSGVKGAQWGQSFDPSGAHGESLLPP